MRPPAFGGKSRPYCTYLDGSRIGGLGLSREELTDWLKLKDCDAA